MGEKSRNPDPGTVHPEPENRELETRNPSPKGCSGTSAGSLRAPPKPETRNPEHGTRNPESRPQNPKPGIRNPEPETWDPKTEK